MKIRSLLLAIIAVCISLPVFGQDVLRHGALIPNSAIYAYGRMRISPVDTTAKTAGMVLTYNGGSTPPSWTSVGTGNAFMTFAGPASTVKTFTLPNASSTILTSNAAVTAAQGGTGIATTTAYSPVFSGTTATGAFSATIGPGTSGQVLTSNGAAAYPSWQAGGGGGSGAIKQFYQSGISAKNAASTGAHTYYIPIDAKFLAVASGYPFTFDPSDPANSEVDEATYFPSGDSIKSFYFFGNQPGSGHTFTVTLMKNGVATAATYQVTFADADVNGNAKKSDLTHTIAISANDLFAYKIVTDAGSNQLLGNMVCQIYTH